MAEELPRDDLTIPPDAILWRRVPERHWLWAEEEGRWRPKSWAFADDEDGPMSVILAEEGRDPRTALAGLRNFALVKLTAEHIRACGHIIVRDRTDDEPAHCLVIGD